MRVPLADGTLVKLPVGPDHALMPGLLTLTDVLGTGHHAALAARVEPGKIVAVVGDGAVGLCGVIAARRFVLEGRIQPGRVFDRVTDLDGVPDGYRAMNDRQAIKVMIDFS